MPELCALALCGIPFSIVFAAAAIFYYFDTKKDRGKGTYTGKTGRHRPYRPRTGAK